MSRRVKAFFKVVVLGNSGVGKSSLLHRYVREVFVGESFKSTIGADFLSKQITVVDESHHNNHRVTLQLWDTAGQERFVSLCVAFYRGADALVLVYDGSSPRDASASLDRWYEEFSKHADVRVPVLVLVNKSDLLTSGVERDVAMMPGEQWAREHAGSFAVVSALNGDGVENAFLDLGRAVWARGEGDDAEQDALRTAMEPAGLAQRGDKETQRSCSC
jgi:Ras-related protein Rab-7A